MGSYVIAVAARARLLEIYSFSKATFGEYQADAYHSGMERTFALLSDFPRIGSSADDLRWGYRRYRFQSHYIFYTEEADHIVIRTILHVSQGLRPSLFE